MTKSLFKSYLFLFVSFFLIPFSLAFAEEQSHPCRYLTGYRLRYLKLDKNNQANNVLRVEDSNGFRVAEFTGADCSKTDLVGERLFWVEFPGRRISSYDLKTQFSETIAHGSQFSVSPDSRLMIVEKPNSLSMVNTRTRNETEFFTWPEASVDQGEKKKITVNFLGWPPDLSQFWFSLTMEGSNDQRLFVLTKSGDLIRSRMTRDPSREEVFYLDSGWLTGNNGSELTVTDVVRQKKIILENFSNKGFQPHWTSGGNLIYQRDNNTITVTKDDIKLRLDGSVLPASIVEKSDFVPVSW